MPRLEPAKRGECVRYRICRLQPACREPRCRARPPSIPLFPGCRAARARREFLTPRKRHGCSCGVVRSSRRAMGRRGRRHFSQCSALRTPVRRRVAGKSREAPVEASGCTTILEVCIGRQQQQHTSFSLFQLAGVEPLRAAAPLTRRCSPTPPLSPGRSQPWLQPWYVGVEQTQHAR